MTSGSDDFFLTLNVWSFKSRHVELGTFEIPVVGGGFFKREKSKQKLLSTAKALADRTKVKNELRKERKLMRPEGHSFDAIASLRQDMQKLDPYYIYKCNNRKLNGEPSFVFLMSKTTAKIALAMDRDLLSYLSEEWCFFDGSFKQCKGFVKLMVSMYHPLLLKMVKLASMYVESEDTKTVQTFWTFFNEVLRETSNNSPYKFNPEGIIWDENSANWKGSKVMGEIQSRANSCGFHFKNSLTLHKKRIQGEEEQNRFRELAWQLYSSATESKYFEVYDELLRFIDEDDKRRDSLYNWLQWWHKRRSHVFTAFKYLYNSPGANLAESCHSSYVSTGSIGLTLLDAAYEDISEFIEVEAALEGMKDGTFPGGCGPNQETRTARQYAQQEKRAKEYAERIKLQKERRIGPSNKNRREEAQETFVPEPGSTHRPDKSRQPKRSTHAAKRQKPWRPTASELFTETQKKAKSDPIKLVSTKHIDNLERTYTVRGKGGINYVVRVSCSPSCTCPYYVSKPRGRDQICKHIVFVYINVLNLDCNDPLIWQVALVPHEVEKLFSSTQSSTHNSPPDNISHETPESPKIIILTQAEQMAIFAAFKNPPNQKWLAYKRIEDSRAMCAGCAHSRMISGRVCLEVDALYIPGNEMFCKVRTYYFCANDKCIRRKQNKSTL